MKVGLLTTEKRSKGCMNKDLAGGMGTRTWIGGSIMAKLVEIAKSKSVKLPPLTLAYINSIFGKYEHEVSYYDNIFPEKDCDLFIVPVSIVDYRNEIRLVEKLKDKFQGKIAVFGTFASVKPEIFKEFVDLVIVGEPEQLVEEIAKNKMIPTGVVKSKNIENLNRLPFPEWDLFPLKNYSYKPVINKKNVVTMLTSRGCPFSCGYYCPYPLGQGKTWRYRDPKNVVDEMTYVYNKYNVRGIDLRDPNFTLNKKRVEEIAKELILRKLRIEWSCETHLKVLDEGLIELLYEAGLRNINVGIESASAKVLKTSKRLNDEKIHQEETIRYCEKRGISVAAFYILGMEGDTQDSVLETIKYAKHLNTKIAQFTICTPYPGTGFYKEKERLLTSHNWEDFNAYDLVFKHHNLSRNELLGLKEYAWTSYYFRTNYILKHVLSNGR